MNINPELARDVPCKNVLIYGYCKFENKGCAFSHPAQSAVEPNSTVESPTRTGSLNTSSQKSSNSNTMSTQANSNADTLSSTDSSNSTPQLSAKPTSSTAPDTKRKFNMNTPSFQPAMQSVQNVTSKFAALSPKLKEIPVFVPSGMDSSSTPTSNTELNSTPRNLTSRKFDASTPSFTPSSPFEGNSFFSSSNTSIHDGFGDNQNNQTMMPSTSQPRVVPSQIMQHSSSQTKKQQNPYLSGGSATPVSSTPHAQTVGADFMFHNQSSSTYPLNYHLYAPAPPPRLAVPIKDYETNVNLMFIPNDIRETITKKNEATLQTLNQSSLPTSVGHYHSLVPIDSSFEQSSKVYQLPTCVYKVLSNLDGLPYALRRIDFSSKCSILNEQPFANVKRWKSIKNPNVARLHNAFTSVSFGSNSEPSLFLAYDYYPTANTLQEQHVTRKLGAKLLPVNEDLLWTYLVQLTGALISIHAAGLHAGSSLSMSKVLVTNKNRVRLGAVGIDDILNYQVYEKMKTEEGTSATIHKLQLADINRLGRLMIELASASLPTGLRGLPTGSLISHLQSSSTISLTQELLVAVTALTDADETFNLNEYFSVHLSKASLELVNGLQDSADFFESQLSSEVENGRLFRLLAKINVVMDRPELDNDFNGGSTVIRLFRDHLFRTVDESGHPAVDLSRILVCLNKLDVGVDEKLMLISGEEDNCIIVSYKEIKDILDQSFRALIK